VAVIIEKAASHEETETPTRRKATNHDVTQIATRRKTTNHGVTQIATRQKATNHDALKTNSCEAKPFWQSAAAHRAAGSHYQPVCWNSGRMFWYYHEATLTPRCLM
jgi:hypothetical protein